MISRERILELARANAGGGNTSMTPHEFSELLDGYIARSPNGRERQEFIDRAALSASVRKLPSECWDWAERMWEEREKRRKVSTK